MGPLQLSCNNKRLVVCTHPVQCCHLCVANKFIHVHTVDEVPHQLSALLAEVEVARTLVLVLWGVTVNGVGCDMQWSGLCCMCWCYVRMTQVGEGSGSGCVVAYCPQLAAVSLPAIQGFVAGMCPEPDPYGWGEPVAEEETRHGIKCICPSRAEAGGARSQHVLGCGHVVCLACMRGGAGAAFRRLWGHAATTKRHCQSGTGFVETCFQV